MEMRACEDTDMSQDLTPPIIPIAVSLHDTFLHSHCSSCFRPISNCSPTTPYSRLSCFKCNGPVHYCSPECHVSDSIRHTSSGECHLFRLLRHHRFQFSTWQDDVTTDIRAALRALHSLEKFGLLSSRNESGRIGGLLAGNGQSLEEGSVELQRIREGAELMYRARRLLQDECLGGEGQVEEASGVEEALLWVVLTNAVEVQVGDGASLGVALYGPWFSWFNHSCSPNSCYRFELAVFELPYSCKNVFRIVPDASREDHEADVLKTWVCGESISYQDAELCIYGPRVVVRSIKTIKKGEEVFITYTDLLQPKALRHSELWSRYHFVCCCSRCSASPETYVDRILSGSSAKANVNSEHDYKNEAREALLDVLDQAVTKYLSVGNPEACCEMIENMLCENFHFEQFRLEEALQRKFKLHHLHHISLKAYMILASGYRMRANTLLTLDSGDILEPFEMSKAAAAYSLLLAGATHHLFSSELSLTMTAALSWIDAGESLLLLLSSSVRTPPVHLVNASEFHLIVRHSQGNITQRDDSPLTQDEFKETTASFLNCIWRMSSVVWSFLVSGLPCLKCIKNPMDFSLLERTMNSAQLLLSEATTIEVCIGCKCEAHVCIEEEMKGFYRLGIHCLIYGGYLANICYGSQCYQVNHVKNLLDVVR